MVNSTNQSLDTEIDLGRYEQEYSPKLGGAAVAMAANVDRGLVTETTHSSDSGHDSTASLSQISDHETITALPTTMGQPYDDSVKGDRTGITVVRGSKDLPNMMTGSGQGGTTLIGGDTTNKDGDTFAVSGEGNRIIEGKAVSDIQARDGSQTTVEQFSPRTTIEMHGTVGTAYQVGNDTLVRVGNTFLTLKDVDEKAFETSANVKDKDGSTIVTSAADGSNIAIQGGGTLTAVQSAKMLEDAAKAATPVKDIVTGGSSATPGNNATPSAATAGMRTR